MVVCSFALPENEPENSGMVISFRTRLSSSGGNGSRGGSMSPQQERASSVARLPKSRLDSVSETKTVSSTNPVCFFRMGRTLSLMVSQSSLAFPGLVVNSTIRVYMGTLLSVGKQSERNRRSARRVSTLGECPKHTPVPFQGQVPKNGATTPGNGRPLTGHVEDGIGILHVLFQNLDGLGGWQNQQLDL